MEVEVGVWMGGTVGLVVGIVVAVGERVGVGIGVCVAVGGNVGLAGGVAVTEDEATILGDAASLPMTCDFTWAFVSIDSWGESGVNSITSRRASISSSIFDVSATDGALKEHAVERTVTIARIRTTSRIYWIGITELPLRMKTDLYLTF